MVLLFMIFIQNMILIFKNSKREKVYKVGYKTLLEPCQIFDNWFNREDNRFSGWREDQKRII